MTVERKGLVIGFYPEDKEWTVKERIEAMENRIFCLYMKDYPNERDRKTLKIWEEYLEELKRA